MSRVIHFEIHASDPDRAIRFYTSLFDWTIRKWEGPVDYWTIDTGHPDRPGINGGLVRRRGEPPVEGQAVNAYPCTIGVEDLDGLLGRVPGLGGSVAFPKMPIPGVGWLAYVKDTEGNILGLMQPDPTAKM